MSVLRTIWTQNGQTKLIGLKNQIHYVMFYHFETFLFLHQVRNWRILAVTNGIYRTFFLFYVLYEHEQQNQADLS